MGRRSESEGWVSRNRWPLGICGIIAGFFLADGILVIAALRDASFGPEEGYYEKALRHDAVSAALGRARRVGLRVRVTVGQAPLVSMPRRVDVFVSDKHGNPVDGLQGTLAAVRPADVRLRDQAVLVGVPGESGLYRLLLRVPVSGLWIFELDAHKDGEGFRVVTREDVRI